MDALWREYGEHPRVDIWFGPQGPNWVSDDFMVRIAERAASYGPGGTGIQTHVAESLYEKLYGPRTFGEPVVLHLQRLGVLGPRFSLAHAVWLTEAEIEVLAETGTAVSHNPSSNLKLRAGILPARALVEAGATVGLGLDGHALDDDDDIFREMRLAWSLQRDPRIGTPALTPREVSAARYDGQRAADGEGWAARAAGAWLPGGSGAGRPRPARPGRGSLPRPTRATCWCCERSPATCGRCWYTARWCCKTACRRASTWRRPAASLRLNWRLRRSRPRPPGRIELLAPHLAAFYQAWEVPALEPYVRQNART